MPLRRVTVSFAQIVRRGSRGHSAPSRWVMRLARSNARQALRSTGKPRRQWPRDHPSGTISPGPWLTSCTDRRSGVTEGGARPAGWGTCESPFTRAWSPHCQAERRFVVFGSCGWARPFPRTGCAPRASRSIGPNSLFLLPGASILFQSSLMLARAVVFGLTVATAGVWALPQGAAPAAQGQPAWQRTDSRRFEIHYLPAVAGELERVTRSAERAYNKISARLNFTLGTKVPLVMFAPSAGLTLEQVAAFSVTDAVAPQVPHRSRIVLPLRDGDAELDTLMVHELTHLLVSEIILPHAPGTGGVPGWVHEGIASYMANEWPDDYERLMRDLVAADKVPALSALTGDGGFVNPRMNHALGHVVFD